MFLCLPRNKHSKTHLPGWCLLTSQCTTLISTCSVSSNSLLNSQVSKKWQCYHSYKNWCHFYLSKKQKCHHSYNNFVTFPFFNSWVSYFVEKRETCVEKRETYVEKRVTYEDNNLTFQRLVGCYHHHRTGESSCWKFKGLQSNNCSRNTSKLVDKKIFWSRLHRTVKLIRYVDSRDYFVMACEFIYMIFVAYYIVEEV